MVKDATGMVEDHYDGPDITEEEEEIPPPQEEKNKKFELISTTAGGETKPKLCVPIEAI